MFILFFFVQYTFATNDSGLHNVHWYEQTKEPLMAVIDRVIEEISQRYNNCIVFINDLYHYRMMDTFWIKKYHLLPVYMVVIRENEDFSLPRNQIHSILTNSKLAGCSAYIILNTNGLQVSQLLQYGERERLVNTHGYFLFLHDSRLFRPEMNYIWNRIINVVFIHRYDTFKHRSNEQISREWIHLNTVHFPVHSEASVRTKHVDTWYRDKFRYNNNHFLDKARDLQKKTLRVAAIEHIPAVTKHARDYYTSSVHNSTTALGIEFELIQIIGKFMNFKIFMYTPPGTETEKWGTPRDNETYSGLLGEAVAGRAAFLLGDLHYTLHHLRLLDLSLPYNVECLTFLTPESLTDNSWKLLIMPFKLYMWIAVFFILITGGCILWLLALCYKKHITSYKRSKVNSMKMIKISTRISKSKKTLKQHEQSNFGIKDLYVFTEPQSSILYTYSMLLLVSLPRLPNAWALRIFTGCWWLYSILIAVAYRANMTAILANPIGRITIDTIKQLATNPIAVGGWEEDKQLFLSSLDLDFQKLGSKFELMTNEEEAIARVANGSFAYYENKYFLRQARARRQLSEDKQNANAAKHNKPLMVDRNLHIMEECVINMPISLGLDKNSPLKPHVDKLVRRVVEAGLVQKWLSDVMQWAVIAERPQETGSKKALIDHRKLYGPLVALGIGYIFGFVALGSEILYWKYVILRNPNYDKYHLDMYYRSVQ